MRRLHLRQRRHDSEWHELIEKINEEARDIIDDYEIRLTNWNGTPKK